MPYIKTPEEIGIIKQGGKILGEILEKLSKMAKPGASAFEIDQEAERLIRQAGGRPAFKGYQGKKNERPFPNTICACVNEELVHGIASKEKILKDGDIFSIDIGMAFPAGNSKSQIIPPQPPPQRGPASWRWRDPARCGTNDKISREYFTDTSLTLAIGKIPEKTTKNFASWQAKQQLLAVTKKALEIGIKAIKVGGTIADIGKAIENYVTPQGYGVVRDLVGHGVGHAVHEDPRVPNYYEKDLEKWELRPGVVIAIEPMITMGDYHIVTAPDGWSVSTADNSLCAHFEHTVAIDYGGQVKVVTRRPSEKF